MRVPDGTTLTQWIRELEAQGRLYRFYKTREWARLKAQVMAAHHNECADCAARGEYARAVTVHHVNEVRERPDLALSATYVGADGKRHDNLVPLCNRCHNRRHHRFDGPIARPKAEPVTEERW